MDQTLYMIISFISGVIFMKLWYILVLTGRTAIMIKQTINDCLVIMSTNIQTANESYEIKYLALEIAERDEKYIDFQKKVDKQQLKTIQKTLIRSFLAAIPPKYNYLIKFHDWDSAMSYLTEEIKKERK